MDESHSDITPQVIMAAKQTSTPVLTEKFLNELWQKELADGSVGLLLQAIEKGEKPRSGDVREQGPDV